RCAKLVAHVREKTGLEFARLAQLFGALVKFGIESDDPTIGVAKFLVELLALLVSTPDLLQALHQLVVLLAQSGEWIDGIVTLEARGDLGQLDLRDARAPHGKLLAKVDRGPPARLGLDLELIHQATSTDDSKAHPALRAVLAVEDALQIGD